MFILILTLLGPFNSSSHVITAVSGFTSETACIAAANVWVKNTDNVPTVATRRAACVKA